MAFINERPENEISKWRTVDYERNAILRRGDSFPRTKIENFHLSWEGETINFSAWFESQAREDGQYKITWKILDCGLPEKFRDRKQEVRKIITEAMDAYGVRYGKSNVYQTDIIIDPAIENLKFPSFN